MSGSSRRRPRKPVKGPFTITKEAVHLSSRQSLKHEGVDQLEDAPETKNVVPLGQMGGEPKEKDIYSKLGDVKDIKGFLV